MAPKLTLYVDTVSPFAYIAYYITRHDPTFSKCEVTYVPILLGGVMKACGNPIPISIKNKDKWIVAERLRWSRLFSVPHTEQAPDGFPSPTLNIMRAMCALSVVSPGQDPMVKCLDALFEAYWVRHEKTNDKDVLARVLEKELGSATAKKVMEKISKEGKEILAKNSEAALALKPR